MLVGAAGDMGRAATVSREVESGGGPIQRLEEEATGGDSLVDVELFACGAQERSDVKQSIVCILYAAISI